MIILSKFAENLFSLMQEHNVKAPALGKILNTSRTNITRYLRGERLPLYKGFVGIIEYFNVSADVILGRTDYCKEETFRQIQPFGDTLRRVLEETHVSQYKIQKELHFSTATIYNWLVNKSLPSVDNMDKIADFLDVTVDYLLGRTL